MSNDDSSSTTPHAGDTSSERLTGRVKWFNNRAGFGFVTVMEGEKKDEDREQRRRPEARGVETLAAGPRGWCRRLEARCLAAAGAAGEGLAGPRRGGEGGKQRCPNAARDSSAGPRQDSP